MEIKKKTENESIISLINKFINYQIYERNHSLETANAYENELLYLFYLIEENFLKRKKYKINSIKEDHIIDLIKVLQVREDDRNSVYAIARKISCLNSFFTFLKKRKLIIENIMDYISIPKLPKIKPIIPNDEQSKAFMKKVKERKYYNDFSRLTWFIGFRLFYETGIRTIELVRIKVKDINFNKMSILVLGKGNKERYVYFQENLRDKLKTLIIEAKLTDEDLILRTINNKPISTKRAIQKRFETIRKEADLPNWFTPHKLRKYNLTKLSRMGFDLIEIQDIAGHEDPKTTRIYVSTNDEDLRKKYQKMDSF